MNESEAGKASDISRQDKDVESDWFDHRLEHDPRFLARIEQSRQSMRKGKGIRLKDIEW